MTDEKPIIGRVEKVKVANLSRKFIHARIDTGATISSLWASNIHADDDGLHFTLFGEGHPLYTGEVIDFAEYDKRPVRSSNGQAELRYQIKTPIKIKGKKVNARFTLADRSSQVYPILIGRNVLRGKFVVDVAQGKPMIKKEKSHRRILNEQIGGGSK